MKKKILSIVLALCMVISLVPTLGGTANASAAFSGGDGSSATPYLISTAADLAQLAINISTGTNYTNKIFKQTDDIDLNSGVTFTFEPDTGLVAVTYGANTFYLGTFGRAEPLRQRRI